MKSAFWAFVNFIGFGCSSLAIFFNLVGTVVRRNVDCLVLPEYLGNMAKRLRIYGMHYFCLDPSRRSLPRAIKNVLGSGSSPELGLNVVTHGIQAFHHALLYLERPVSFRQDRVIEM